MPLKKKNDIEPVSITHEYYCSKVARYWRLLPWEFRELKSREKGELSALYDIDKEIESYYHDQIDRKHPVSEPNAKRKLV